MKKRVHPNDGTRESVQKGVLIFSRHDYYSLVNGDFKKII